MSSRSEDLADLGLLSPVWVGTRAERLTSDQAVAEAMVAFEEALLAALSRHGLAPGVRLAEHDLDVRALAERAVEPGNPTLAVVGLLRGAASLREVRDDAPDGWVHHGSTSQDTVDSALMRVATTVLGELEGHLVELAEDLARLADRERATPCVARTLTQQAMPTSLGFRAATWLAGVHDALGAVRACRPLPVSLGGPVGTAAAYGALGPDVVASVAAALGLGVPVMSWHTRRTPLLGLAAALASVGQACGRLCADLLLMAQTEVGEASDGSGGASSAMAHKANPTRSVLVCAAVQQLPPLLASVAASGAAASERPPGAWHAEWQPLRTMLRLAGAAAERTADVTAHLSFDREAMRRNLDLLVSAVGEDAGWVDAQTEHVGVWVDRVLARHAEVVG